MGKFSSLDRIGNPGPSGGPDKCQTFDYSLVIPVYLNAENIDDLLEAVGSLDEALDGTFEAVFVVDGSPDLSLAILSKKLPEYPFASQLISLSRNFGSFAAIRQGLEASRGEYVAVMAADLQEPPELVLSFFQLLRSNEADVVFGRRIGRKDHFFTMLCSDLFWGLYRRFVLPDIPKGGVDIFACNRMVKNSVLQIAEPNSSLIAQLFWVGFRREFVPYARRNREKGKSAWKFWSRVRYMFDSVFLFSDLPVILVLWTGGVGLAVSIVLGLVTLFAKLMGGIDIPGYTTIILLQLLFFSMVLLSQGVIGSYLWRTFENTKKRPITLVHTHEFVPPREKSPSGDETVLTEHTEAR